MQTRPLHLCSISCSLLTRTRMLWEKNSNINYTDVKLMLKHPYFSARGASGTGHVHADDVTLRNLCMRMIGCSRRAKFKHNRLDPRFYLLFLPCPAGDKERREPKMVIENSTEISKSTASLWSVEYIAHEEFTRPTLSRKYSRRPHYIGEIRKSSFISTVRPPVTLIRQENGASRNALENTGFSLSCGQKI